MHVVASTPSVRYYAAYVAIVAVADVVAADVAAVNAIATDVAAFVAIVWSSVEHQGTGAASHQVRNGRQQITNTHMQHTYMYVQHLHMQHEIDRASNRSYFWLRLHRQASIKLQLQLLLLFFLLVLHLLLLLLLLEATPRVGGFGISLCAAHALIARLPVFC